jgi:hypothetical protein
LCPALQIQKAIHRLRKGNGGKRSGAECSQQQPVPLMTTEAPEDVHRRKRIKLQPGWLYHASPDGVDENLLILLHGYGDTPGDSCLMLQCMHATST